MDKHAVHSEKLNDLQLIGLEKIQLGEMLHYAYIETLKKSYIINAMYHILCIGLFAGNNFYVKGKPDKLFLFSSSYVFRKDLLISFDKVFGTCDNAVKMIGEKSRKLHFQFLKYLKLIFVWNSQLKATMPNMSLRWYYLEKIFRIFIDYKEYEMFVAENEYGIKKMVTWCDVQPVDYYFTQKFQEKELTTITLQHGVFSSQSNPWTFINSRSDFFLVHGQFTIDEAARVGYPIHRMIPVGLPSSIGENFSYREGITSIEKIGVIPEGEACHEDNVQMILFVQEYCRNHGKKMVLKLHPTSKIEQYQEILDSSICVDVYGKEIRILEFAGMIDVAIIRNSTGLLEMVEQLVPSFVYYSDNQKLDVFKYVDEIRFKEQTELQDLVKSLSDADIMKVLWKRKAYFCSEGDVASNYRNAITDCCVIGDSNE